MDVINSAACVEVVKRKARPVITAFTKRDLSDTFLCSRMKTRNFAQVFRTGIRRPSVFLYRFTLHPNTKRPSFSAAMWFYSTQWLIIDSLMTSRMPSVASEFENMRRTAQSTLLPYIHIYKACLNLI